MRVVRICSLKAWIWSNLVATDTYSGIQSYHEMMKRAQATSPALTYALCKLLLGIPSDEKPKKDGRYTSKTVVLDSNDPFAGLFHKETQYCQMSLFAKEVFGSFNVGVGYVDTYGTEQCVIADMQFVEWLRGDVVVLDDEKQLVTLKL